MEAKDTVEAVPKAKAETKIVHLHALASRCFYAETVETIYREVLKALTIERANWECNIDDVVSWAGGTMDTLNTEHAHKVTNEEIDIAAAIMEAKKLGVYR